jgi:uncharacterized protein (DUF1499 family)
MMISACPNTPNCVSSVDTKKANYIPPLNFNDSARSARYRLLKILHRMKRARVVEFDEKDIRVEYISSFFKFVDDVSFYLDSRDKVIHVRSASRIGYYDLGVNRRRVEKIREMFEEQESIGSLSQNLMK